MSRSDEFDFRTYCVVFCSIITRNIIIKANESIKRMQQFGSEGSHPNAYRVMSRLVLKSYQ